MHEGRVRPAVECWVNETPRLSTFEDCSYRSDECFLDLRDVANPVTCLQRTRHGAESKSPGGFVVRVEHGPLDLRQHQGLELVGCGAGFCRCDRIEVLGEHRRFVAMDLGCGNQPGPASEEVVDRTLRDVHLETDVLDPERFGAGLVEPTHRSLEDESLGAQTLCCVAEPAGAKNGFALFGILYLWSNGHSERMPHEHDSGRRRRLYFLSNGPSETLFKMTTDRSPEHWAYRLTSRRLRMLGLFAALPPALCGRIAEKHLRRPGQPGPAGEHVQQYLVSGTLARRRADEPGDAVRPDGEARGPRKPVHVGQADFFYRSQYRSRCSAVMGAFAATATQVLAASGSTARGVLWGRHRECHAAMLPRHGETGIRPILVLNDGAVAVAVHLPRSGDAGGDLATEQFLFEGAALPERLGRAVRGEEQAGERGIGRTLLRDHAGSVAALVDAARTTGKLALLALHPRDPDAMGLHITLFGVEVVRPDQLMREYGLTDADLEGHRAYAQAENAILGYLVGGTEEVFTQCSQNLFVKELVSEAVEAAAEPTPESTPSLEQLLAAQFESLQVTVDSSALPGASPRNGQIGGAALVGTRRGRKYVLIPYHPGNAIHGHAAKLWTNRRSALVVSDDHTYRRRATISGVSRVASHAWVTKRFPAASRAVTHPEGGAEATVAVPLYWFVTRADEVIWERGVLPEYGLSEGRAVCTINAGGQGRHTKQPKYFDAGTVDPYDLAQQHHREAGGRPTDPSGIERSEWLVTAESALAAREEHLRVHV